MALATGLAEKFRVFFLNGGPLPDTINFSEKVEIIDLPPLGLNTTGQIISRDPNRTVDEARDIRRKMILETFNSLKPEIVLIELFPFGRKKFKDELLPMLDQSTRAGTARSLVVCSLRDILVGRREDQIKHDERASELANRYFDSILVHSDQNFARLEESFHAYSKLIPPVHYTGYVSPARDSINQSNAHRQRRVVVSAGGGLVGYSLLRTALDAHALLEDDDLEMRIIAGPFLPDDDWHLLLAAAKGRKGIQLIKAVPDLCEEMRTAAASVSQCGYNTTLDILQSGVSALVVPFGDGGENEQMQRAERLERIGAVRVLDQLELNARRLADEIRQSLNFKPQASIIDLNGVNHSVRILEKMCRARQSRQARLPFTAIFEKAGL
jgi:predicted glycosyltransferase